MHRRHGLVSIVVTNRNNERFIGACLNSLRHQTYKNIELIVVDDASSDNSRHVIRSWKRRYKSTLAHRMITLYLPRNIGFAGAVETALYLAKGEYIAMQDGDDLSLPRRIETQVNFLRKHRSISVVGTNYVSFRNGKSHQFTHPHWMAFRPSEIRRRYHRGQHCISHGTVMMRGRVFDKIGGPTRRMKGAEDYETIAKCIEAGYRVANLKTVLYRYRMHTGQRSRKYYRR